MIFSEKTLWALLIAGSGAATLVLWIFALFALVQNLPLKAQVPAKILQWEVEEIKSDRFALRALYDYEINGKSYQGNTLFRPAYLNEFSAIADLKEAARSSWTAWVSPSHPEKSTLEKIFPRGLLFRAITSSLVMIYFILVYRRKYFNNVPVSLF